jgi:hypothetical protein
MEKSEFRFDSAASTTSLNNVTTSPTSAIISSPASGPDVVTIKVVYPPTDGIISFRIKRSTILPELCEKIACKFKETEGLVLQWGQGHWGLAYLPSSISGPVSPTRTTFPNSSESTNRRQSVGRSRSNSIASITSTGGDLSTLTLIVTRFDWEDLIKRCGERLSLRITEWVSPV